MMWHLRSGYHPLGCLADGLEGAAEFADARQSMILEDNYSTNRTTPLVCNAGTDVSGLRSVCKQLRLSVLHANKRSTTVLRT